MRILRRKNKNEKKIKPNIILFYFCYSLILICSMLRSVIVLTDMTNWISRICIVILIFACIISLSKIEKKKALVFFLITIVAIITRVVSGNNYFLLTWLFAIAARSIDFEQIVKYDLLIKIPLLIIVPCLYFAGLTEVNIHYRDGIARHSMGFSNPNIFSAYLVSAFVDFLYLRKDKVGILEVIVAIFSGIIVDYYADSRTSVICIILMTIAAIVVRNRGSGGIKKSAIRMIVNCSYIILLIVSVTVGALYSKNNVILSNLDDMASTRISSMSKMLDEYDINLVGHDVKLVTRAESELTGEPVSTLDNMYVYSLLSYGVIATIVYCVYMQKYMSYTSSKNKLIRAFMLIYLLAGLMERFPMDPRINICLLYFSQIFYDNTHNRRGMMGDGKSD